MIGAFIAYLQYEKNYSARTLREYEDDLAAFERYYHSLDNDLTWQTVDTDVIRCWMEEMMDRGNAASSVNRRLSALRSFYRYALSRGLVASDPAHRVTGPKRSKPLPQFLREGEMDRLIDGCLASPNDYDSARVRTIIIMFYSTGLRVSELVSLNDSSVDMAAGRLRVVGKRNKERIVPFGDELRQELERYMALRNATVGERGEGALFVSAKGRRLTDGQVRTDVKKWLSMVSTLKKRTPHVLRHTFATAMLNNGAGLETVKKLLGHQSLATTEIYTHTTFEHLKQVYRTAHPRSSDGSTAMPNDATTSTPDGPLNASDGPLTTPEKPEK